GEWNGDIYLHLNLLGDLEATATPAISPVIIPAAGGSFDYNIFLANNTEYNVTADVWTLAIRPNGAETRSFINVNITAPSSVQISRDRTQGIPGSAAPGTYQYVLRWGAYPNQAWAESSFPFTKLETDEGTSGNVCVNDWFCTGESLEPEMDAKVLDHSLLLGNSPNPFNPETTLRYALQEDAQVRLAVYDVAGKLIEVLVEGWRSAGLHEVIFSGQDLPSGVYLYRFETSSAGEQSVCGKMILLK
ncbi:MAG: T9SS type A sorting domain-containing protein, partial [bacterium]